MTFMGRIKGVQVTLINKVSNGFDEFNKQLYKDDLFVVENVLISPVKSEEVLSTQNLTGKIAVYILAIPKNDSHDWENKEVEFFGKRWRVLGSPLEGMEEMIPLFWNKKVMVERYE